MSNSIKKILYWCSRLLTIMLALFLTIFAADVFSSGYALWKIPIALFMHLIPSLLLLLVLYLSWKREWIGGAVYIALGVFYLSNMKKPQIDVFFLIPFPLFVIGILFLIGWFMKKKISET